MDLNPTHSGALMRLRSALSLALLLAPVAVGAQPTPADRFSVTEVLIPARDGVGLHTRLFIPKAQAGPLPFIMMRTPYGIAGAEGNFNTYMRDLADDGYIFVF